MMSLYPTAVDLDHALSRFGPVSAAPVSDAEHQTRIVALQERTRQAGLAAVWLDASSSLTYFTGLQLGQSERIHGALITSDGPPVYVTPVFEAPKLNSLLQAARPAADVGGRRRSLCPDRASRGRLCGQGGCA